MKETKGIGILMLGFGIGLFLGLLITPDYTEKEVTVEVEKFVEVPSSNQTIYSYCARQVSIALYSSWDGDPKVGTTPENTQEFIDNCYNKLKN